MPSPLNQLIAAQVTFFEIIAHPIFLRALIVGTVVSVCAAMLGVILVLKRYALIGHGLGEVSFAAMSLAALIGLSEYQLIVAIPLVCLSSILIMRLSQRGLMGGDVMIGIFSTAALAAGVLAASFVKDYSGSMLNGMFGYITGLGEWDVWLSLILSALVVLAFTLLYNRLFSVTYDEVYARASGLSADSYQFIISLLTSITVVLGMRVIGAMMISSFIIFPAMTARRLAKSFRGMILCAMAVALISFLAGITVSNLVESMNPAIRLPTGACVVAASVAIMCAVYAATGVRAKK